jgi:hypothetical protein
LDFHSVFCEPEILFQYLPVNGLSASDHRGAWERLGVKPGETFIALFILAFSIGEIKTEAPV